MTDSKVSKIIAIQNNNDQHMHTIKVLCFQIF